MPAAERRLADAINTVGLAASEDLARWMADDVRFETLRASDWPILRLLLERGPVGVSSLARPLEVSQQGVSKAITSMEFRDFVVRDVSPTDRRIQDVLLTKRGYAALDAAARWATDREVRAEERWGFDDVRRTTVLLGQFTDGSRRSRGRSRNLRPQP